MGSETHYRQDINGLRALAILLVLFFHAGSTLFPSGFIGVDIFFVISGFLITGVIQKSLLDQSFSLLSFYNRRLWRLQPVYLCLILVTAFATLCFFLPEDLLQYFKSARKSTLFLSNTFFERITTGYFSPANTELPLLHTWSLSIEWQFYCVFPLGFYWLHQRQKTGAIYGLTLLFLVLALYSSLYDPSKNYYQAFNRIFEFLIGACLVIKPKLFSGNQSLLNIIGLAALASLFYIAGLSNIAAGFPNAYALLLCLATAVLILLGQQRPKLFVTQCLEIKPLVFIGLMSYSLYIWHWPLFVFLHYLDLKITPIAFIFVFLCAYLSWRLIEKPTARFKNTRFAYSLMVLLIIPILIIQLGQFLVKKHAGYPNRFTELSKINQTLERHSYPARPLCLQEKNTPVDSHCRLGTANAAKTGFMLGDSYANHYWGFMDKLAKDTPVSILAHATAACLTLPGIVLNDWNAKPYTACQAQTKRYFRMIRDNHYDFVILAHNWQAYLSKLGPKSPKRIEQALDKALSLIVDAGSRPIIIKSIALDENTHACFYAHIKKRTAYQPKLCQYFLKSEEQKWQDELFLRMKRKYTTLRIIDPKKVQCRAGVCTADIEGVPLFRDKGHITDFAAVILGERYLDLYRNPLV